MSYDPACETLARHFLGASSERLAKELAQHIQDEVESWIESEAERLAEAIERKITAQ